MIKWLLGIWMLASAGLVYAACSYHTYYINGQLVTCTTCCAYGNCNTTCN